MTYRESLAPMIVRPRWGAVLPPLFLLGLATLGAPPATAQAPRTEPPTEQPVIPANDRAALRAEADVARRLAWLDEELRLGTFPDGSPLWPQRLAAALRARNAEAPAGSLFRHLATELRGLEASWELGGVPDTPRDGRPTLDMPSGRERAERIQRIHELVRLVERKLGPSTAVDSSATEESAVGNRQNVMSARSWLYGSDSCTTPVEIGLGNFQGYTSDHTNDGGSSCDGSMAPPDVWYRFTAPEDGAYTFATYQGYDTSYDTVLSLHSDCPIVGENHELACSDDHGASLFSSITYELAAGESVLLRVAGYGGASGWFDLRITLGRTVRGTVTEEGGGDPVAGAEVAVIDYYDYEIATTVTDAEGTYVVSLPATTYNRFARAERDDLVRELYQGIDCTLGVSCTYPGNKATELDIESSDVDGVDFTLLKSGSITGSVHDSRDGSPLDPFVYVYDETGEFVGAASGDADGSFELSRLEPGDYFVRATANGYRDEVWDDLPCLDCDVTTGRRVTVVADTETGGIDFDLDVLGSIEGTVLEEASGEPVVRTSMLLYDENGVYQQRRYTTSDGTYSFQALPPGTYYIRTSSLEYFDELHEGLPCEPNCTPTTGTPLSPQISQTISGIDFTLVSRGTISGTITDAVTGAPLDRPLRLYNSSGQGLSFTYRHHEDGAYTIYGLVADTYYLTADEPSYSASNYEPQLYDGQRCPFSDCDPTTGLPIVLATDTSHATGVDFQLVLRGSITGKVVSAATGNPVTEHYVRAYDAAGVSRGSGYTGANGLYKIYPRLPYGEYTVGTTDNYYPSSFRHEMWNDVPCGYDCDRTTGDLVTVQPGAETPGIDFALDRLGSIAGTVSSLSPEDPHLDADVYLFDPAGQMVSMQLHGYGGNFVFEHVYPGTYYLVARDGDDYEDYQDVLYPDVPCDPSCDVTDGTPVVIAIGEAVTDIDWSLSVCPAPSFGEINSTVLSGYVKTVACETITVGDSAISSTADVIFRAGRSIVLGDGFVVEEGAKLRLIIEPGWSLDD